ncbi:unnamed protein product [Prorocentrum cordatum]|uniref:Uncharacterized protein n=1 Tax=Prorocentrum cordatum TaxID=2364126 RepID=A0ABN9TGC1_9DINO|nr:unnamed protein product [Polarella glacialis]
MGKQSAQDEDQSSRWRTTPCPAPTRPAPWSTWRAAAGAGATLRSASAAPQRPWPPCCTPAAPARAACTRSARRRASPRWLRCRPRRRRALPLRLRHRPHADLQAGLGRPVRGHRGAARHGGLRVLGGRDDLLAGRCEHSRHLLRQVPPRHRLSGRRWRRGLGRARQAPGGGRRHRELLDINYDQNAEVSTPLVVHAVDGNKQDSVRSILEWARNHQGMDIKDARVWFFDDLLKNVEGFRGSGFNARQVSCKSRGPVEQWVSWDGKIGGCGAVVDEIVPEEGVHICEGVPLKPEGLDED